MSNTSNSSDEVFQDPLVGRYTSKRMQELFSNNYKFRTWRKCWIALAEAQYELQLKDENNQLLVTKEQVDELKQFANTLNLDIAKEKEKEIRHDVMSHVYAFGQQCKNAEAIIHLGATSCFVTCNTELIQQKQALSYIKEGLMNAIHNLSKFASKTKDIITLGYTHYQPAQPTTIGKRMTLHIQDLLMDLTHLEFVESLMRARSTKGTTGTQATYFELLKDKEKVRQLESLVRKKLGFKSSFPVTGQTYPRKLDSKIAECLAGIAISAHKFAVDLRLMSNLKIMEEPFAKNQTGSSAMAYKRNPMRSERLTALSRYLLSKPINFYHTAANQWFERTLDDSSIRRLDIAQSFLAADAILKLLNNITSDMVVYPNAAKKILNAELPFMATEEILMKAVAKGKSRQEMHELVKHHSLEAGKQVKQYGKDNDLLGRLADDPNIPLTREELNKITLNPECFAGLASHQTELFLSEHVEPILEKYSELLGEGDYSVTV